MTANARENPLQRFHPEGEGSAAPSKPSLDGLPTKPSFADVPRANLSALIADLDAEGEPAKGGTDGGKKLKPGEALRLDTKTMALRRTTRGRKFYDLTKSKVAVAQIVTLPGPDESVHCVMGGEYDGFDLVIAVHALAGAPVDRLQVATLGFNRYNIAQLCAMLDAGQVGHADLVCSEYFASADAADFNASRAELERRGARLVAVRNHAKVLLFAIGERRFVVESSANLRSCNNLEQFVVTQSAELHDFHAGWIGHIISTHG